MRTSHSAASSSRDQAEQIITQRPSIRYFKGSDEISTLKDNVIKCLRKELEIHHLKFKNKHFSDIFNENISKIYKNVH